MCRSLQGQSGQLAGKLSIHEDTSPRKGFIMSYQQDMALVVGKGGTGWIDTMI